MKIGIPRALLYYYYGDLWIEFFRNLKIEVIISPQTNTLISKRGINYSIDEACYSSKIFIGHVEYLLDKCDYIFIPRIENIGLRDEFCTRIFGVYDLVKNTFHSANILTININYFERKNESDAFMKLGSALNVNLAECQKAYESALQKVKELKKEAIFRQKEILEKDGLKVLIASHPYNIFDAIIGKSVLEYFKNNKINVVFSHFIDDKEAKQKTKENFGNRFYWKVSYDMIGGTLLQKDAVDGIVLLSTFPCGPDSILNELIIRTIKDKPIITLMMDEHDAKAGLITRLESFTDILIANKERKENDDR